VDVYLESPFRKRHVAEGLIGAGAGVGVVEVLNRSYGTDYSHLLGGGIGAVGGIVLGETFYALFSGDDKDKAPSAEVETAQQDPTERRIDKLEDAVAASLGRVEARLSEAAAPPVASAQGANDQLNEVVAMLAQGQQQMVESQEQMTRTLSTIAKKIPAASKPPTRQRKATAS
jgi:hypothetical protein